MENNESKIKQTIQTYVDGYLNADSSLIKKAINEEVRLYNVKDGKINKMEMNTWLKSIDDRKASGDIRHAKFEIGLIDITADTAFAKLMLYFEKRTFTDYLTFLNVQGNWIIISKIYSFKDC